MARPPIHLEWMLSHADTAEEKYEILRLNDCLSAQALSFKAGVMALIEKQMQAREQDLARHLEANRNVIHPPGSGQFIGMHVEFGLKQAGYLNERGLEFYDCVKDPDLPIRLPGGDFKQCGMCRRLVMLDANFCPQCGNDFNSCPTCGQRHPRHPLGICPN